MENYSVKGFLGTPENARRDRKGQYLYLNQRYIKDKVLYSAITNSLSDTFMKGRHPYLFLFLEVAPHLLDVNVHPQKFEVRFLEEKKIYSLLYRALRQQTDWDPALFQGDEDKRNLENFYIKGAMPKESLPEPIKPISSSQYSKKHSPKEITSQIKEGQAFSFSSFDQKREKTKPSETPFKITPQPVRPPSHLFESSQERSLKLDPMLSQVSRVFQIHNSYIIAEVPDGIRIIDQHALHEKILFMKFLEIQENRVIETQGLLFPQQMDMSPSEKQICEEFKETFQELGFDFHMENQKLEVFGVPAFLGNQNWNRFFMDVLSDLEQEKRAGDITRERLIATLACRSALKQGKKLKEEEIFALIQKAMVIPRTYACAHGRPTYISLTLAELEQMFGRKG